MLYPHLSTRELLNAVKARLGAMGSSKPDRQITSVLRHDRHAIQGWEKGARVREDNLSELVDFARGLGIEPLEFCPQPEIWQFQKPYESALELAPPVPVVSSSFFVDHCSTLLGRTLRLPFGMAPGLSSANLPRIRTAFRTGLGFVGSKTFVRKGRNIRHPFYLVSEPQIHILSELDAVPGRQVVFRGTGADRGRLVDGIGAHLGLPSPPAATWCKWIREILAELPPDQLFIPSIAVETERLGSAAEFVEEFFETARLVYEAGSEAVELNWSATVVDQQFLNDQNLSAIVDRIKTLGPVRIVVKLPWMSENRLRKILSCIGPQIDAVAGISGLPVEAQTLNSIGEPERCWHSGLTPLSGRPIKELARQFLRYFKAIRAEDPRLEHLQIISVGGISNVSDIQDLLGEGADAVAAQTVFLQWPYFGLTAKRTLDDLRLEQKQDMQQNMLDYGGAVFGRAINELLHECGPGKHQELSAAAFGFYLAWYGRVRSSGYAAARSSNYADFPTLKYFKDGIKSMYMSM